VNAELVSQSKDKYDDQAMQRARFSWVSAKPYDENETATGDSWPGYYLSPPEDPALQGWG
jgi:hypothetical protein